MADAKRRSRQMEAVAATTHHDGGNQHHYSRMEIGDPLPHFVVSTTDNPKFGIDRAAGRYILICCFGSAATPMGRTAIEAVRNNKRLFSDSSIAFFGVTIDRNDIEADRLIDTASGVRFVVDYETNFSRSIGALPRDRASTVRVYNQFWMLIDPSLHVAGILPFDGDDPGHERVLKHLQSLPKADSFSGIDIPAPILVLPNVFEPAFCSHLIDLYEKDGGSESGVMRDNKGIIDRAMKSRSDFTVDDEGLKRAVQSRILRRVATEIERIFFMKITRMERYLVGCYSSEAGGHFSPHRDNEQAITAHRRFAVSINLNSDFEGGELAFPEFSWKNYKAPAGWGVVFPCNCLHTVSRVTKGRRYAFLPFLYDEAGAAIRERNLAELQKAQ